MKSNIALADSKEQVPFVRSFFNAIFHWMIENIKMKEAINILHVLMFFIMNKIFV